jgi:hypothetical protein
MKYFAVFNFLLLPGTIVFAQQNLQLWYKQPLQYGQKLYLLVMEDWAQWFLVVLKKNCCS